MAGKAIHVVLLRLKWAVLRYGDLTPLSLHDRREEAIAEARALAKSEAVDLVVFDLGGCPIPPTTCD